MNEIEVEINKYSSMNKNDIFDFINLGNKIRKIKLLDRDIFGKYCRNLCNFLINHTDLNYLVEVFNNLNSEMISNYNQNKQYIKQIIYANNKLLTLINSDYKNENKLEKSNWQPLDEYIKIINNITNYDGLYYNFGETKSLRLWVDLHIIENRIILIKKKELINVPELSDLLRYFNWITFRLLTKIKSKNLRNKLLFNIEYIQSENKINDKVYLIDNSIEYYKNILLNDKSLVAILPRSINDKKERKNINIPLSTSIAVGTVLITGILYKIF